MNDSTSVGKRLHDLQIGPEFDTYTMVIIHAGQITDAQGNTKDLDYIAGNTVGRTLELTDPLGTQAKANSLLAKLQTSKWQYQPYDATDALLDPAAELGDGLTVSDAFSAVYRRDVEFTALMAAQLQAPSDEEIDHEYKFIPKEERVYKRETAFTRSQLKINENAITAEVQNRITDVNNAKTTLRSELSVTATAIRSEVSREVTRIDGVNERQQTTLTQHATDIAARVLKKSGTNTIGFGWDLTDSQWIVGPYSGGKIQSVLTINKNGLSVTGSGRFTGEIRATSGYIGSSNNGFTIKADKIYNGKSSRDDTANGIYIGKDGIALGADSKFKVTNTGEVTTKNLNIKGGSIAIGGTDADPSFQVTSGGTVKITGGSINLKDTDDNTAFKVDTSGNVSANNMTLTGKLTIDGKQITASDLYTGASKASSGYSTWDSTSNTVSSNSDSWTTGSNYGYNYNDATVSGTQKYPSMFTAGHLIAKKSFTLGSYDGGWREITYKDGNGNSRTLTVLSGQQ